MAAEDLEASIILCKCCNCAIHRSGVGVHKRTVVNDGLLRRKA